MEIELASLYVTYIALWHRYNAAFPINKKFAIREKKFWALIVVVFSIKTKPILVIKNIIDFQIICKITPKFPKSSKAPNAWLRKVAFYESKTCV